MGNTIDGPKGPIPRPLVEKPTPVDSPTSYDPKRDKKPVPPKGDTVEISEKAKDELRRIEEE